MLGRCRYPVQILVVRFLRLHVFIVLHGSGVLETMKHRSRTQGTYTRNSRYGPAAHDRHGRYPWNSLASVEWNTHHNHIANPRGQHGARRACQIFYELKGGTVCYGSEHSRAHGHACHGETYETGSFPEWGEDNPVHFVGHSFGGQTARILQHLVATGEG